MTTHRTPPRRAAWLRLLFILALLVVLALGASLLHPQVRYVAIAASYQLELLWGRVPAEQVLATDRFTPEQVERLRHVPEIKAYATRMGLRDTGHYSTITPTWDHTVYNVSACEELSFRPRVWWFPIVGQVPYLGYFDEQQAQAQAQQMRDQGLDVYVRTAGAWSTLGWFEDPLLPHMADWTVPQLANTLFHELTHATVWVPGSVAFNESLASFVGETAGMRWLVDTYGEDSNEVREERLRRQDRDVFLAMMRKAYDDLDAVYSDPNASDGDKRRRKASILDGLPDRARKAPFQDPERWAAWFEQNPWNNAQLVQFRVYNRTPEWFQTLLDDEDGDLGRFLERVRHLGDGGGDPYLKLAEAAGIDPETLGDEPVR